MFHEKFKFVLKHTWFLSLIHYVELIKYLIGSLPTFYWVIMVQGSVDSRKHFWGIPTKFWWGMEEIKENRPRSATENLSQLQFTIKLASIIWYSHKIFQVMNDLLKVLGFAVYFVTCCSMGGDIENAWNSANEHVSSKFSQVLWWQPITIMVKWMASCLWCLPGPLQSSLHNNPRINTAGSLHGCC